MTARWPERGRCGACRQPAERYPSGRWRHLDKPCPPRSRDLWSIDDLPVRELLVFVPDGEPLPRPAPRWIVTRLDPTGFPSELAWLAPHRDDELEAAIGRHPAGKRQEQP